MGKNWGAEAMWIQRQMKTLSFETTHLK
jgi:hypothetical protein